MNMVCSPPNFDNYNWAPKWVWPLAYIHETKDDKTICAYFMWDDVKLANLKAKWGGKAMFQHQFLRSSCTNYWDFLRTEWRWYGPVCVVYYSTNLPKPDPFWSEECQWIWGCTKSNLTLPGGLFGEGNKEEAQINCQKTSSLKSNKWYFVNYKFKRVTRNKKIPCVYTEAEVCGTQYPNCGYPLNPQFESCILTSNENFPS